VFSHQFSIKFTTSFSAIQALKEKKYEDAWLTFDHMDIDLSNLESNFDIEHFAQIFRSFFAWLLPVLNKRFVLRLCLNVDSCPYYGI